MERGPNRHLQICAAALLLGVLMLAGCATAPAVPMRREALANQIADDSIAFNEAYGRSVSGQILLNILRARDRQPRYYLSMSGIQDAPTLRYRENAGISSIPLGEAASPWGFAGIGIERETASRPSYAVSPWDATTLAKAIFQPTAPHIFAHYWTSGWSRDLLLMVMVERLVVEERTTRRVATNDAADMADDCPVGRTGRGCAFVTEARNFLAAMAERAPRDWTDKKGSEICGLIAAYGEGPPVRAQTGAEAAACEPRIVVGEAIYTLELRSFDDMIFFVGELMRRSWTDQGGSAAMAAPVSVRTAGLRGGGGAPLFRILPAAEAAREAEGDPRSFFAANIHYGGQRYFAGPPVARSCPAPTRDGPCRDAPEAGDRTSSVLSLLSEILALNQSPEAVRPPTRLFTD